MTCVLDFWNRQWQSVAFDTRRGKGRVRWIAKKPIRANGWACRHRGAWYCLWSDGKDIVFQAKRQRWTMNDEYACGIRHEAGMRHFTISRGPSEVFEVSYKPGWHEKDPVYDDVDLELEDFFVFVARHWSNQAWKELAVQNWSACE